MKPLHENFLRAPLQTRVAESEVKSPTFQISNSLLRLLNMKGMKFGC